MSTEVLKLASLYSNIWLISDRGRDKGGDRGTDRQKDRAGQGVNTERYRDRLREIKQDKGEIERDRGKDRQREREREQDKVIILCFIYIYTKLYIYTHNCAANVNNAQIKI